MTESAVERHAASREHGLVPRSSWEWTSSTSGGSTLQLLRPELEAVEPSRVRRRHRSNRTEPRLDRTRRLWRGNAKPRGSEEGLAVLVLPPRHPSPDTLGRSGRTACCRVDRRRFLPHGETGPVVLEPGQEPTTRRGRFRQAGPVFAPGDEDAFLLGAHPPASATAISVGGVLARGNPRSEGTEPSAGTEGQVDQTDPRDGRDPPVSFRAVERAGSWALQSRPGSDA
jgi:hypothetical protein